MRKVFRVIAWAYLVVTAAVVALGYLHFWGGDDITRAIMAWSLAFLFYLGYRVYRDFADRAKP